MNLLELKNRLLQSSGSLRHRLILGTVWSTVSNLASRVAGFVSTIAVARLLERTAFGQFGILSVTLNSFGIVATLGMGVAAAKLVAQNRTRDPAEISRVLSSATTVALLAGGGLTLVAFAASPWLASDVLNAPELAPELRIIAPGLLFVAWGSCQGAALAGLERFSVLARFGVVSALLTASLTVALTFLAGLRGAALAYPVGGCVQCIAMEIVMRRVLREEGIRISYRTPLARLRLVLALGVPAMLSAALFLPTSWACSTMLVNQAQGYREMAVVTASEQWFNLLLTLPVILGQVLLPVLSSIFSAGDADASRSALARTFWANAALSILPLFVLVPLSPYLIPLYGSDYGDRWPVLSLLLVAGSVAAVLSPAGHALTATGRMWLAFTMNLGWSVAYVTATYVLVVVMARGAFGLALARVIAYGFHACWSLAYLRSVLRRGGASLEIRV